MNCFLLVWYTSEQEVKQVVRIIEDETFLFVILNIGSGLGTTSLSGTFGLTFRCGQWSNISAIQSEVMLSLISQSHPPGAARAIMLVVQVFDLSSIHRALNLWSCLLLVTLMIVGLPLCVCKYNQQLGYLHLWECFVFYFNLIFYWVWTLNTSILWIFILCWHSFLPQFLWDYDALKFVFFIFIHTHNFRMWLRHKFDSNMKRSCFVNI